MKTILKNMKGYWLWAVLAPTLMVLEVTMDLQLPSLMSKIINVGVANGDLAYIWQTGLRMILFALIGVIGGMGCTVMSSIAAYGMGTNLREVMFAKIQSFSFAELDRLKPPSLVTRLTNDVTQVQNMLMMALRMLVRAPAFLVGGLIMAYTISPRLSLIFLAAMPLLFGLAILLMRFASPLFKQMQTRVDNVNTVMREGLLGVRVIKAFNSQDRERTRFGQVSGELMGTSMKAMSIVVVMMPMVTLIMNLSIVALYWFGGNLAIEGQIASGDIMAFSTYMMQVLSSLIMVAMIALNASRAQASLERIDEVIGTEASIVSPAAPKQRCGVDVEFDHVSFSYSGSSGESVLKDISFTAKKGQTIGIIGGTGSGKSTFVSLIPRLYDATSGSVRIGGVDVRELALEDIRSCVGVVFQDSLLFSGSVEENLRWGDPNATEAQIDRSIHDAQAYEFLSVLPEGLDTYVEQRGSNFSGGQKQRLSIARTFVKQPEILVLDDSTSAVDLSTEARIQQALRERGNEGIVFIIAQRISAISDADKIIVLDNGSISAEGTHRQLLRSSEIYRSIAVSQLGQEVLENA